MSVIDAVYQLGLGPAERILACKVRTTTPAGLPVECGRTPGHRGAHMTTSANHRWPQRTLSVVVTEPDPNDESSPAADDDQPPLDSLIGWNAVDTI